MTNNLMEKLGDWLESRSSEERRLLAWGSPLILGLLLYLLVAQPVGSAWYERQQLLDSRLADLEWLRAQATRIESINTVCAARAEPLQLDRIEAEINSLGQRLSLRPQLRKITGEDRWVVQLESAPGNRVLAYTRSLVCAGLSVSLLDFSRPDPASDLGRAELQIGLVLP